MKKLALLFLVLPLPAFAESVPTPDAIVTPPNSLIARPVEVQPMSKETLAQIAKAESYCRSNGVGPSVRRYTSCVTEYLQDQDGIILARDANGGLVAVQDRYVYNGDNPGNWVSFGTPFPIQAGPPQLSGR